MNRRCLTCPSLNVRRVLIPLVELDLARPGHLKRLASLEVFACRECVPEVSP